MWRRMAFGSTVLCGLLMLSGCKCARTGYYQPGGLVYGGCGWKSFGPFAYTGCELKHWKHCAKQWQQPGAAPWAPAAGPYQCQCEIMPGQVVSPNTAPVPSPQPDPLGTPTSPSQPVPPPAPAASNPAGHQHSQAPTGNPYDGWTVAPQSSYSPPTQQSGVVFPFHRQTAATANDTDGNGARTADYVSTTDSGDGPVLTGFVGGQKHGPHGPGCSCHVPQPAAVPQPAPQPVPQPHSGCAQCGTPGVISAEPPPTTCSGCGGPTPPATCSSCGAAGHTAGTAYDGGVYDGTVYDGGAYDGGVYEAPVYEGEVINSGGCAACGQPGSHNCSACSGGTVESAPSTCASCGGVHTPPSGCSACAGAAAGTTTSGDPIEYFQPTGPVSPAPPAAANPPAASGTPSSNPPTPPDPNPVVPRPPAAPDTDLPQPTTTRQMQWVPRQSF